MEPDNTNGSTSSKGVSVKKSHSTTTPQCQVDEEVSELDDGFEVSNTKPLVSKNFLGGLNKKSFSKPAKISTSPKEDAMALEWEMQVEQRRMMQKQQSSVGFALKKVTNDADYDAIDVLTDDTFSPTELNVALEFNGLSFFESVRKVCAILFITLEIPSSSFLAKLIALTVNLVVITAVVSYVASTEVTLRIVPETCFDPACNNDPVLCPGFQICEDIQSSAFTTIDDICTYLFTIEYGLRFLTCWSVTPRVAGTIPHEWEVEHRHDENATQPKYSIIYTLWRFFFKFKNLIDIASILPFFVGFAVSTGEQSSFVRVLRLLRLIRVLRLLKLLSFMKNVDVAMELISETLRQSTLLLSVFMFFVLIVVALFGCVIYLCEGGDFTVNSDYPMGAYLRQDPTHTTLEVTPFDSIATGIYWVIGTATGAGDLATTTIAGRAVACALELVGILGMAFPVGVIGSELDRAYTKHFVRLMKLSDDKRTQIMEDAILSADVVKKPNRKSISNGNIDNIREKSNGTDTPPTQNGAQKAVALLRFTNAFSTQASQVLPFSKENVLRIDSSKSSSTDKNTPSRNSPKMDDFKNNLPDKNKLPDGNKNDVSIENNLSFNRTCPSVSTDRVKESIYKGDTDKFNLDLNERKNRLSAKDKKISDKSLRDKGSKSLCILNEESSLEGGENSGASSSLKRLIQAANEDIDRAVSRLRCLEDLEKELRLVQNSDPIEKEVSQNLKVIQDNDSKHMNKLSSLYKMTLPDIKGHLRISEENGERKDSNQTSNKDSYMLDFNSHIPEEKNISKLDVEMNQVKDVLELDIDMNDENIMANNDLVRTVDTSKSDVFGS